MASQWSKEKIVCGAETNQLRWKTGKSIVFTSEALRW